MKKKHSSYIFIKISSSLKRQLCNKKIFWIKPFHSLKMCIVYFWFLTKVWRSEDKLWTVKKLLCIGHCTMQAHFVYNSSYMIQNWFYARTWMIPYVLFSQLTNFKSVLLFTIFSSVFSCTSRAYDLVFQNQNIPCPILAFFKQTFCS